MLELKCIRFFSVDRNRLALYIKKNNSLTVSKMTLQIILIHGNGNSSPNDNWLPYVKQQLEADYEVLAPQFPDLPLAREEYWLPFLKNIIDETKKTVIIGHSTGAIAAMRFAETNKILGSVLVGTYATDLGIESEILSGYFNRPWNWDAIKNNQTFILQFASVDDPWIPIAESRIVHEKLNTAYHEFSDQGHFGGDYDKQTFPELVLALKKKLDNYAAASE